MKTYGWVLMLLGLTLALAMQTSAEILNNDEFGSIEIRDLSVIDKAADIFTPVGLHFSVTRGGIVYSGDDLTIYYQGVHQKYSTLIDYSPDRKVKPLVMNRLVKINDNQGGLERNYTGTVGNTLGKEYVLLITSNLPLDDKRVEDLALAPDKIEIKDDIIGVAVNDFQVLQKYVTPDRSINHQVTVPVPINNDMMIPLSEFATYNNYPLNMYPYDPWPFMYLYPYPRFQPYRYISHYGPLTNTWYVFPGEANQLRSNFWNYASDAWIDNGVWVVPPGGSWQGSLRVDDAYTPYYLRVLPFLARENRSYLSLLQVEINGTLVQPDPDLYGGIGYGQYTTYNPFDYYNLNTLLHRGENQIRIYWPADQTDNFQLQMMDVLPSDVAGQELKQAEEQAQQNGQGDNGGSGQ